MKKSKIAIALLLSLMIVIQSISVLAAVNLGKVVIDINGEVNLTGSTFTTDKPSVGQSVYVEVYDTYGSSTYNYEIQEDDLVSVAESVYTYKLDDIGLSEFGYGDTSVTAKVYDPSIGFIADSKNINFESSPAALYGVWMDTFYGDDVRNTVYGYIYKSSVRISMPFNTIADDYEINYFFDGDTIYLDGQDISIDPDFDLQQTVYGSSKCDTVSLSVYNGDIVRNYNLDVYLNTPGTATVGDITIEYPYGAGNQTTPVFIWGQILDEDSGNVGVTGVWYTLQNSSGNYFEYDYDLNTFTSVTELVYNGTYYSDFYDSDFNSDWVIPIASSFDLPDSTYTLTVFANDGEDGIPVTKTFTVKTPTTENPGTGGTPSGSTSNEPTVGQDGTITVPATKPDIKGNAVIPLTAGTLKKALDQTKADANGVKVVKIVLPEIDGAKAYLPELPAEIFTSATADTKFEISTEFGTVLIPANMLKETDLKGAQKISLSIALADTSALSDELKEKIGKKPVLDLGILVDGKELSWSNSSAPVTVTIPYTLTDEEASNSEFITVWYIDSKGKATPVPTAKYNKALKAVTFSTTHFSQYALVYNPVAFSDIASSFAKNSITVLASKGITSGTGTGKFSPTANITRADFLVMLVKALGLTADFDTNFSDVKSSAYYYNAVGIAKKLGIVSGTANGNCSPSAYITRQDMMVMAAKAMKLAGKEISSEVDLKKFTDASSIASYAVESISALVGSGIVSGNGKAILPTSLATREQAAQIIYKIYNK